MWQQFKKLIPEAYALQKDSAEKAKHFVIQDTSFSTITVNYSWRTACHQDRGDFPGGFGNLVILEDFNNPNNYTLNHLYLGFSTT